MFHRSLIAAFLLASGCAPAADRPAQEKQTEEDEGGPNQKKKTSSGDADKADKNQDSADRNDGDADRKPDGTGTPKDKQRVELKGSKGDKMPGYLWLPALKSGEKAPAILLMYGISDDKDSGTIGAAAKLLAEKGYASLTVDWPGTGERGSISKQDRIINASVKDWTVADYGQAVAYLAGRPEIDSSKIAYVGASMGAMTGLAFAAKDPRVKAMVAIVPIPNPLWGSDAPESAIRAVAPRPVLCISTSDNSDLSSMVCGNNGGENRTLAGGHELQGMHGEVVDLTVAFLKKSLK